MRDLRFACRRLAAAPVFTLFSVATLAIGIGVTTTAYSFLYALIWRGTPVSNPERIVDLTQGALYTSAFSRAEFRELAGQSKAFSSVAASTTFSGGLAGAGSAALVNGAGVTGHYFQTLGLRPLSGRTLLPADDSHDAAPVAVLSETLWRQQFRADPEVLGTSVRMAGLTYEVVGVMPAAASRWRPRSRHIDVWVPLKRAPSAGSLVPSEWLQRDNYRVLDIVARLAPGQTLESANAELSVLAERFEAISPLDAEANQRRRVWADSPFVQRRATVTENEVAIIILALPALVLLIACTNLANLALSRGGSRRHEIAVRRAIGAPRWRLVREQLIEGVVVAVSGGLVGLLLTQILITTVQTAIHGSFGDWAELRIDARVEPAVLVAVGVAAALALVVSSLVPALQLTRSRQVKNALADDSGISTTPRWRGRSNLIALQVAASVGLFLIAALLVRGIFALQTASSRIELDRVVVASVPFGVQTGDATATRARIERAVQALGDTPGVNAVALASLMDSGRTRSWLINDFAVTAPDSVFGPDGDGGIVPDTAVASTRYFDLVGRRLRYGRLFEDRDDAAAAPVAIVDESLARKTTGVANAVGRQILLRRRIDRSGVYIRRPDVGLVTIVGVLEDIPDRQGRDNDVMFLPFAQQFDGNISLLVRGASTDLRALAASVRDAIHRVDPDLAIGYVGRADVAMQAGPAMALGLLTTGAFVLATIALVLSMAGLYGVLSHVVSRRTREMGLRMALGADAGRILRMVLYDGFRPVLEGAAIGLGAAAIIRLWMQQYFSRVTATAIDPLALALGLGPLVIAAAIACYLPARRAAKVDPNVALREL